MTTWRSRSIAAGAVLALLALAYLAGRRSAPAKTVTADTRKAVTDVKDKAASATKTDERATMATVADAKVNENTKTTIRWLPSPAVGGCPVGPPIVEETIEHTSATASHQEAHGERQAETKATAAAEHDAHQATQETRTVTVTAERPRWAVTALAGASLGSPPRLIPGLPAPLVVGAAVERRILGPLSAGLWATSAGAGGVSVRVEF